MHEKRQCTRFQNRSRFKKANFLSATYRGLGDLTYFVFAGWGPSTLFEDFSMPDPRAFDRFDKRLVSPKLSFPSPLPSVALYQIWNNGSSNGAHSLATKTMKACNSTTSSWNVKNGGEKACTCQ